MVGKAQKSHGARSELNSVFGLEKVDRRNPIRTSAIQSIVIWYILVTSQKFNFPCLNVTDTFFF
jgi:hypothetical protein